MTIDKGKVTVSTPRQPYRSSEDRRAEIAQAAIRCLMRHGYARVTARKVAQEAGLSLGHITYHFKDMNELLAEAYRQMSALLAQETARSMLSTAPTPCGRLRAFLWAGFSAEMLTHDHIRLRIDLWSASRGDAGLCATERALYDDYRSHLTELLGDLAGGRNQQRIAPVADAIMALLDGLWLDWIRRGDHQAVENGLQACLDLAETLTRD